jgi:non-ribosomal peptide synthetase component F
VRLTYEELNKLANLAARYIKETQSSGKDLVALCIDKSHVLAIAVLAVLNAGMAWVPLRLDASPARIERILRSCNPGLVLTSKSTRHIVGDMARSV